MDLITPTPIRYPAPFELSSPSTWPPAEGGNELARRPLVPLVHGVEDRLRAVSREGEFYRRADAVNDAPLVKERQVENAG